MNRIDYQMGYGLVLIAVLVVCGLGLALGKLWECFRLRATRLTAAELNQLKPGCFMMNKEDQQ